MKILSSSTSPDFLKNVRSNYSVTVYPVSVQSAYISMATTFGRVESLEDIVNSIVLAKVTQLGVVLLAVSTTL